MGNAGDAPFRSGRPDTQQQVRGGASPALLRLVMSWLLLAVLLGLHSPRASAAEDFIAKREVLADADGRLTLAEAMQRPFRPMPAVLTAGYSAATYWVRLTLRPPDGARELVLRIRPAHLDDLLLHAPAPGAPGQWVLSQVGDRFPQGRQERHGATHSLLVQGLQGETVVYLRVRSTNNLQMYAQAMLPDDAAEADALQATLVGMYFGVMLALVVWALVDVVINRDRVVAWFIPYQWVNLLFGAGLMGYFNWLLPPMWSRHADLLTSSMVIATPFFSIICNRALLATQQAAPWGLKLLAVAAVVPVLEWVALLAGFARPALLCNTLLILSLGVLLFIISLTTRSDAPARRRMLRWAYAILLAHMVLAALAPLALINGQTWLLHSSLVHGLLTGVMMFALLHLRSRDLLSSRQRALVELQLERERAERERLRREDKARFMTMLTHELHQPLMVMRLALAQADADPQGRMDALGRSQLHQAVQGMESLIERCVQADRVEQTDAPLVLQRFMVAPVMQDLLEGSGQAGRVVLAVPEDLALSTDESLFRIIVGNLLDNALKYSAEGQDVEVTVRAATEQGQQRVEVLVANLPGPAGLPDPQRVFQKYYRSRGATKLRGTGLGLWLIRALSQQLGGDATLQNNAGRVEFRVHLPG